MQLVTDNLRTMVATLLYIKRPFYCIVTIGLMALCGNPDTAGAQSRTGWTMHHGLGVSDPSSATQQLVRFSCAPPSHGHSCEYDVSDVPPENGPDWVLPPDRNQINIFRPCGQSLVCQAPQGQTCRVWGDFTYFQTYVDIPPSFSDTLKVVFTNVDDGARIHINNSSYLRSTYPDGFVIPGSDVILGETKTVDITQYLGKGEENRIAISQVDDCCCVNSIRSILLYVNNTPLPPTGCQASNDPNVCGQQCCQVDGTCGNVCPGQNRCAGVNCTAFDACHVAGVCDPATGQCSNPPAAQGAACNDHNACTQTDQCDGAGTCRGTNPVVCTALDQCHAAGSCDLATGLCSNPPAQQGTGCDDSDACTQTDVCDGAGTCSGTNPVACTALDQCHAAGSCDSATGVCSNPSRPDGTACEDGRPCTVNDTCHVGACVSGAANRNVCGQQRAACSQGCQGLRGPAQATCKQECNAQHQACLDSC